jgi:hypothetical protein
MTLVAPEMFTVCTRDVSGRLVRLREIIIIIIVVVIVIGSTALSGPWSPQANVDSDLYPDAPSSFYNPVSLRLPLPRQSSWISVVRVLVDLQGLSTVSF